MPNISIEMSDIKPNCFDSSSNCSHLKTTYARKFGTAITHPSCVCMNKVFNKIRNRCISRVEYIGNNENEIEQSVLQYDFVSRNILDQLFETDNIIRTAEQRHEAEKAFCFIKIAMFLNLYAKSKLYNHYLFNNTHYDHTLFTNVDYILGFDTLPRNFNRRRICSSTDSIHSANVFLYKMFNDRKVLFIQNTILSQISASCFSNDISTFWQDIVRIYNVLEGNILRRDNPQPVVAPQPTTLSEEYNTRSEEPEEEITNEQIAAMLASYESIPAEFKKTIYDILIAIQTSEHIPE